jgi:glycosyltransferase involved in cell wall biosynthesis
MVDFECLVVDDGGTEQLTLEPDRRVKIMRHPVKRGAAASRNTGLNSSVAPYVAFLDDDDVYHPRRLEYGLEGIKGAPISLCGAATLPDARRGLDAGARLKPIRRYRHLNGDVHDVIAEGWAPHLGTTMVEREVMLPFDEDFQVGEDADWWIRISNVARVKSVPECGYLIRRHAGQRFHGERTDEDLEVLDIEMAHLLLLKHREYFAAHPRAAAYRERVLGGLYWRSKDRRAAKAAFLRSLRVAPSFKSLVWYARSLIPAQW